MRNQQSSHQVADLVQPTTFAGLSQRVERQLECAYWHFDARKKAYPPYTTQQSERDAFKDAVRDLFKELRK